MMDLSPSDRAELDAWRKLETGDGPKVRVERKRLSSYDRNGQRWPDMMLTMMQIPGTGVWISVGGVEIGQ